MSNDQIEGISVLGKLHDVGKIYVPIEILNRSSKLSEIEFALVKTHSQVGFNIVRDIEFHELRDGLLPLIVSFQSV